MGNNLCPEVPLFDRSHTPGKVPYEAVASFSWLKGNGMEYVEHKHFSECLEFIQSTGGKLKPKRTASVKSAITPLMFGEDDPLPVAATDLADLVLRRSLRSGRHTTGMERSDNAEEFERLIFSLVSDQSGYENPEWLMQHQRSGPWPRHFRISRYRRRSRRNDTAPRHNSMQALAIEERNALGYFLFA